MAGWSRGIFRIDWSVAAVMAFGAETTRRSRPFPNQGGQLEAAAARLQPWLAGMSLCQPRFGNAICRKAGSRAASLLVAFEGSGSGSGSRGREVVCIRRRAGSILRILHAQAFPASPSLPLPRHTTFPSHLVHNPRSPTSTANHGDQFLLQRVGLERAREVSPRRLRTRGRLVGPPVRALFPSASTC